MKCFKILSLLAFSLPVHAVTIALDVGHSPKNFGAVSPFGKTEYEYNVQVAKELHNKLSDWAKSVRTPKNDNLQDRAKTPAHLLVSVHHDSYSKETEKKTTPAERIGFSIFVSKKNPFFEQSLFCAKRIAAALNYVGEHRSRYHEKPFKGERKTLLDPVGIYQYDNLVILKAANNPALLIEIGVIQNSKEAKRLEKPDVQERFARAINVGIKSCLSDFP